LLQEGTIVAGYRIDGVLGVGGQGAVYRATQLSLNRVVALKLLDANFSEDPGFRARFEREGRVQAALDHDHIVTVYEAGQSERGLFLAMRLIDGATLKQLILDGELDPRRTVRVLTQVAHALDAAHDASLIHRDVKPQNILIGKGDHAYLADFGLIKAPDEAGQLTRTGQFIGTIDYMAPEQIQGEPATAASDCYALTGVLYECLTGKVPFPRTSEAATLHAHVIEPPPRVSECRPDLPPALDGVIAHGMAKDRSARPARSAELIQAASRALSSSAPGLAAPTRRTGEAERVQTTRVPAVGRAAGSSPLPAVAVAADPRVVAPRDVTRQVRRPGIVPVEPAAARAAPEVPAPAVESEDGSVPPAGAPSETRDAGERFPGRLIALIGALVLAAFIIGFVIGDLVR
jgi:serine/threonine protein kinase